MANTLIQIKRSTTTPQPAAGSLNAGEPAYSYSSNVFFVGSSGGNDVLAIGGKYYVDKTNSAYDAAVAAYNAANSGTFAAAAFDRANVAIANVNYVNTAVQAAYSFANTVYSNYAYPAYVAVGPAYDRANSANYFAFLVNANTTAAFGKANSAESIAIAAYANANTKLATAGGTITGDLVVQGNVTFSGTTTYANTQTLLIGDNILTLNADLPVSVAPSENAGLEVNRGSSSNVAVLWNEGTDRWTFTNDGSTYFNLPTTTDLNNVGSGANTYAASVGVGANTYATAVGTAGNTYFLTTLAGANTAVGAGANAYAAAVGTAGNTYFLTTLAGANTAVGAGANAYAALVGSAANTNAANASYLSTGTVPSARISGSYTDITGVGTIAAGVWNGSTVTVPYGGTGITTATTNGVLFGNGTGAFQVTSAGTEGQVLQANASGVPSFGMLDGGSF